jgi:uncharacterized protein YbjT (DUF2867 family)
MILVIGATGMLGTEVCRLLADSGQEVKAMVRTTSDPAKKEDLQNWGIELVEGDLRFPNTFEAALKNVDTVISTVSSMPFSYVPHENDIQKVDLYGMKNFIHHAVKHDVKHFIYTSFSRQIDLDFPLREAKRATEKQLMGSGMTYTIFRPSYFMETWLSPAVGFDVPHAKANILWKWRSKSQLYFHKGCRQMHRGEPGSSGRQRRSDRTGRSGRPFPAKSCQHF